MRMRREQSSSHSSLRQSHSNVVEYNINGMNAQNGMKKEKSPSKQLESQSSSQNQGDFYRQKKQLPKSRQMIGSPTKQIKPQQLTKSQQQNQRVSSSTLIHCLYSYIKQVKVNPTHLTQHLQKRQKKYDPSDPLIYYPFHPKDMNFSVKTKEGKEGVRNLIEFLEDLESRQSDNIVKEIQVKWQDELHQAANKRVKAMQKGHAGDQSKDIGQLVSEFVSWKGPLSQIIVYGFIDPKQILIEAFLQDDSPTKNNRSQFFNIGAKHIGIDMGVHEKYKIVTVIIFAGGINKSESKGDSYNSIRREMKTMANECQCAVY